MDGVAVMNDNYLKIADAEIAHFLQRAKNLWGAYCECMDEQRRVLKAEGYDVDDWNRVFTDEERQRMEALVQPIIERYRADFNGVHDAENRALELTKRGVFRFAKATKRPASELVELIDKAISGDPFIRAGVLEILKKVYL